MVKRLVTISAEVLIALLLFSVAILVFNRYTGLEKALKVDRFTGTPIDILVRLHQSIEERKIQDEYQKFLKDWDNSSAESRMFPDGVTQKLLSNEQYATSVPILLYHGLTDAETKSDPSYQTFKEQMFALKSAGYNTVTLKEFTEFLTEGKPLKDRAVVITFDDGIVSSFYKTDPIFEALDFNAVMFVITQYSLGEGSNYYLSRQELATMLNSGRWEIQPHAHQAHDLQVIDSNGTKDHFLSNKLWLSEQSRLETEAEFRNRIHKEFEMAKKQLEQELSIPAYVFTFPFGDFGQSTVNFPEAQEVILDEVSKVFELATIYQFWPTRGFSHNYSLNNQPMIKRLNVLPSWSGQELIEVLERGRAKNLPFYFDTNSPNHWITSWGRFSKQGEHYKLSSSQQTTSGQVVLDGSFPWKDYTFSVIVLEHNTKNITLQARVQDSENYTACTFGTNSVTITDYVNGSEALKKKIILDEIKNARKYSISVKANTIQCALDDEMLLSETLDQLDKHGGIGLKVWHDDKGEAWLSLQSIQVVKVDDES